MGIWSVTSRNIECGCYRRGCWRDYLDLRGKRQHCAEKKCVLRIFMTYNQRQILLKLSHYEIVSRMEQKMYTGFLGGRKVTLKT